MTNEVAPGQSPSRDAAVRECESCGGCGWCATSEPDCCGDFTKHGECRGHCFIERQIQEQCSNCHGTGLADHSASEDRTEQSEAPQND